VTWKQNGIKHDTKNNRVRLSKGANDRYHPKAWEYVLVEYETRPGISVENLQQVRAVYDNAKGRWELHLVCKDEIEMPTAPGNETAGIDLGICNFAAVSYSTEDADLYPENRLKQDGYYFPKEIARCDASGGEEATRLHAKWSERRTHFFHSLAKHIVERCVEKEVGQINVREERFVRDRLHKVSRQIVEWSQQFEKPCIVFEDLKEMRDSIDYGTRMNRRLHHLPFRALQFYTSYKAAFEGIPTDWIDPEYTSQRCPMCGHTERANRNKKRFKCKDCAHQDHGDRGAGVNIAVKGIEKHQEWTVPALNSLPQERTVRRQVSGAVDAPTVTHPTVRGNLADDRMGVSD
jgi:putative transposase